MLNTLTGMPPSSPEQADVFLSTLEEREEVLRAIEAQLAVHNFLAKEIFGIRLALDEAIVNGIKHGHKFDATKRLHLAYIITNGKLHVDITDEGPGFDPAAVPDPLADENLDKVSGRGLFLMSSYMESVQFNETGNRVSMTKETASINAEQRK